MAEIDLNIDFDLLKEEMSSLLKSNMKGKKSLYGLLKAIYSLKNELDEEGCVEIGIESV